MDTAHVKAIMRTTTATDVSTQLPVTLTSTYGEYHTRSQMLQKKSLSLLQLGTMLGSLS